MGATAVLLLAACAQFQPPPIATDPADEARCRLQAVMAIPEGGEYPLEVPTNRAQVEQACLEEAAILRAQSPRTTPAPSR
jgi:hypothetical protein